MSAVERRRSDVPAAREWEYAAAPESREIVSFAERYGLFVGGEEVAPRSRSWFTTVSPATEEPLAEIAQAGPKDVELAVAAAREAFEPWSS
jgi:aldehyde dehydrogenase (NAD+)